MENILQIGRAIYIKLTVEQLYVAFIKSTNITVYTLLATVRNPGENLAKEKKPI